ncbi:uncharacterized protein [Lolium perenne]
MEESAIKLFVGQVPKLMTEVEQAAMFCDVAIVNEVTVIRDTATKILRGSSGSVCPNPQRWVILPSGERTCTGISDLMRPSLTTTSPAYSSAVRSRETMQTLDTSGRGRREGGGAHPREEDEILPPRSQHRQEIIEQDQRGWVQIREEVKVILPDDQR